MLSSYLYNLSRHRHNIIYTKSSFLTRTPIKEIQTVNGLTSRTTTRTIRQLYSGKPNSKKISAVSLSPSSSSSREFYDNLRRKTKKWLKSPINSCQDVSMGRFLMREWSGITSSSSSSSSCNSLFLSKKISVNVDFNIEEERAAQQTKILRRWVRERIATADNTSGIDDTQKDHTISQQPSRGNINRNRSNNNSREMVEMLNRCLDSWKKVVPPLSKTMTNNSIIRIGSKKSERRSINRNMSIHNAPLESMRLMNLFHDTSIFLNDKGLRPNQKTYSMCMNVLSLYPEASTACDDVLSLYERCCHSKDVETKQQPDLQFFNVCLHTLAKFGTYHPTIAPILVEQIFQEMTTTINLSPNKLCFVSLLHAWANTITHTTSTGTSIGDNNNKNYNSSISAHNNDDNDNESDKKSCYKKNNSIIADEIFSMTTKVETSHLSAADRTEAILERMIHNYPHLVDVICFNICIDAWGKQGVPERAEALLMRLIHIRFGNTFNNDSNNHVDDIIQTNNTLRPNIISFNSTINAWAKCCNMGISVHRQHCDPQEAIERVGILLQQMKLYECEPTLETFASVMEAYSNTPNPGLKVQLFLDELETMYLEGDISLPPCKVCYLMAIRAWGRTKSSLIPKEIASSSSRFSSSSSRNQVEVSGAERAELLLRRMEELSSIDGDRFELEPCVIIYTNVITAWSHSTNMIAPDRALALFNQMRISGNNNIYPNILSLNSLLTTFCNHGRVEEAQELLEQSKRRWIRPDSKTYQIIFRGYAKSKAFDAAENAHDLLKELENEYRHGESTRKIQPTVNMYSQLLVAWGNSSRNDAAFRAEEIFWQMIRQNDVSVLPDTATFNCVLRAWSKSFEGGSAERAEALLRRVQEEHDEEILVDPISHLHLIYAWAHCRRRNAPREAERHLEEATKLCSSRNNSNWKLTRAHFNGVILAWSKSNDRNSFLYIRRLEIEMDSRMT
mmetsp:Transcript_19177/g.22067  ORF Transcript_19177/g.22067 Transcript_19177/m.22067 type:complete len:961 (-) Transcript_19177:241-3123(-)